MTALFEIRRSPSFGRAGDELLPLARDPVNWVAPTPKYIVSAAQSRMVGNMQLGCVVEVRPDGAMILRVSMKAPAPVPFPELTRRLFAFLGDRAFARPPAKWECRWVPGGWCHFATVLRPPQPKVLA